MRLQGKVAIVTGAGRGTGKQIAQDFLSEGASVVLADKSLTEWSQNVNGGYFSRKESVLLREIDLTNTKSLEDMVKSALENYGKIDILVNNAGITKDDLIVNMTEEQWDDVLAVFAFRFC